MDALGEFCPPGFRVHFLFPGRQSIRIHLPVPDNAVDTDDQALHVRQGDQVIDQEGLIEGFPDKHHALAAEFKALFGLSRLGSMHCFNAEESDHLDHFH